MHRLASVFKQYFIRMRGNPAALGSVIAGLLSVLLIVFAGLFSLTIRQGLRATGDAVKALQVSEQLRALAPELAKAEAHLMLLSRGHPVTASSLDQQLQRVSGALTALEPAMVTLPPQAWSVFHQIQEDWQAIANQAARFRQVSIVELAAEGMAASDKLATGFASIRERSSVLQQYLAKQQGQQRVSVIRWQQQVRSMAWAILVSAFLFSGLTAWMVNWVWSKQVGEITWSAERLAAGDLGHRVTVARQGALRPLAQAVNTIAESLNPAKAQHLKTNDNADIESSLEQIDQHV